MIPRKNQVIIYSHNPLVRAVLLIILFLTAISGITYAGSSDIPGLFQYEITSSPYYSSAAVPPSISPHNIVEPTMAVIDPVAGGIFKEGFDVVPGNMNLIPSCISIQNPSPPSTISQPYNSGAIQDYPVPSPTTGIGSTYAPTNFYQTNYDATNLVSPVVPSYSAQARDDDQVTPVVGNSLENARNTVRVMLGNPYAKVTLIGIENGENGRTSYQLTSEGSSFWVDTDTGMIVRAEFYLTQGRSYQGTPPVSMTDANSIAMDFATKHYPGFTEKPMVLTQAVDDSTYQFTWTEILNGIETPNFVKIIILAYSGEVASYIAVNDPITATPGDKISREEAIEIARQIDDLYVTGIFEAGLKYDYTNNGEKVIVWDVRVLAAREKPVPGVPSSSYLYGVVIDAQTGEILRIDSYYASGAQR